MMILEVWESSWLIIRSILAGIHFRNEGQASYHKPSSLVDGHNINALFSALSDSIRIMKITTFLHSGFREVQF
jgi:hypothetical protein